MKTLGTLAIVTAILTGGLSEASGQTSGRMDHVIASGGGNLITIATGIPYIAIGEFAWGLSDRTTIGVLAGLTPYVEGYGIRFRTVMHQRSEDFRIYFCTPVLYYPKTVDLGGEPWFLTRPNINFEWVTESSFRYKVGASLIAAASQPSLFGGEKKEEGSKGGLWNAVHAGISLPISNRMMFQIEASAVLKGHRLATSDWIGGPPVILVLGVSYALP